MATFTLHDLIRAKIPLENNLVVTLPNGDVGKVKKFANDGFVINGHRCILVKNLFFYGPDYVSPKNVKVTFPTASGGMKHLTDDAIEQFHLANGKTINDLIAATEKPPQPQPQPGPELVSPDRLMTEAQNGQFACVGYFQRHEPFCHLAVEQHPELAWCAFFSGGVPTGFTNMESYMKDVIDSKLASYGHIFKETTEPNPINPEQTLVSPRDKYIWMVDYAVRHGLVDVVQVVALQPLTVGLLNIEGSGGVLTPRFSTSVMLKRLANPKNQLKTIVYFILSHSTSVAWTKPHAFDRWLKSVLSVP